MNSYIPNMNTIENSDTFIKRFEEEISSIEESSIMLFFDNYVYETLTLLNKSFDAFGKQQGELLMHVKLDKKLPSLVRNAGKENEQTLVITSLKTKTKFLSLKDDIKESGSRLAELKAQTTEQIKEFDKVKGDADKAREKVNKYRQKLLNQYAEEKEENDKDLTINKLQQQLKKLTEDLAHKQKKMTLHNDDMNQQTEANRRLEQASETETKETVKIRKENKQLKDANIQLKVQLKLKSKPLAKPTVDPKSSSADLKLSLLIKSQMVQMQQEKERLLEKIKQLHETIELMKKSSDPKSSSGDLGNEITKLHKEITELEQTIIELQEENAKLKDPRNQLCSSLIKLQEKATKQYNKILDKNLGPVQLYCRFKDKITDKDLYLNETDFFEKFGKVKPDLEELGEILKAKYNLKTTANKRVLLDDNNQQKLTFNRLFCKENKNNTPVLIFEEVKKSLVMNKASNTNTCITAYGSTGSGKSYVMNNLLKSTVDWLYTKPKAKDIISMKCQQLYYDSGWTVDDMATTTAYKSSKYVMSKFKLLDLGPEPGSAVSSTRKTPIIKTTVGKFGEIIHKTECYRIDNINEYNKQKTFTDLENITSTPYKDYDEIMVAYEDAQKRKMVSCTNGNSESSRSHVIVTLTIRNKDLFDNRPRTITLIDLAGNEDVNDTITLLTELEIPKGKPEDKYTERCRLRRQIDEGLNINLTLQHVMNTFNNGNIKKAWNKDPSTVIAKWKLTGVTPAEMKCPVFIYLDYLLLKHTYHKLIFLVLFDRTRTDNQLLENKKDKTNVTFDPDNSKQTKDLTKRTTHFAAHITDWKTKYVGSDVDHDLKQAKQLLWYQKTLEKAIQRKIYRDFNDDDIKKCRTRIDAISIQLKALQNDKNNDNWPSTKLSVGNLTPELNNNLKKEICAEIKSEFGTDRGTLTDVD
jgi:hypothetical protein